MAWVTPITDRASVETRTTAADMNRIAGNIEELGGDPVKTDYTWADIVQKDEWDYIVNFAYLYDHSITDSTHFENLNSIERILLFAHSGNLYPLESLYPTENLTPDGGM